MRRGSISRVRLSFISIIVNPTHDDFNIPLLSGTLTVMAASVGFTRSKDHVQTDVHQKIVIDKTKEIKSKLLLQICIVLQKVYARLFMSHRILQ